ncbi:MAG TPA: hypothetical protein PLV83_05945 [Bacilli bacterium]|nr:hypothetical protein [Bacilli bacterium]
METEWNNMDINQKRNEVDSEFNKLILLLEEAKKAYSLPTEIKFKNYDVVKDANMSDDDYLKLINDQIKGLRETILTLLYYLSNNVDVEALKAKLDANK